MTSFTEPLVIVPGRVAWLLERNLPLEKLRQAAWGQDGELYTILQELRAIGLIWQEQTAPSQPIGNATRSTPKRNSSETGAMFTTADVAAALDLTAAGVRKASTEGRLHGTKQGGRWRFSADAVAAYQAVRQGKAHD